MTKSKAVVIASLSSMLFLSGVSPSLASTSETTLQGGNATAPSVVENTNQIQGEIQPRWKAKVASESIEKLADLIDSSYVDNIIDAIPKKYRPAFKNSKDGIVDNLRDLAAMGDAGEEYVQNVIVQAIMATGAPSSTANVIANVLVFVFL
ncbi:hypothetical protein [Pontibacillus litoralis]|uniref:Uncharacterized protein n=1 Tax=Pontibacillus litoralis JSM 072002 TaxID=1385512 RepID=A0A0A5G171_9BACI|nr:hypothetical protein [Pontibacillus litoralis]KGX85789.1 hypothetical protein N784_07960 [Pontibacillus litoralis JSM 072002]